METNKETTTGQLNLDELSPEQLADLSAQVEARKKAAKAKKEADTKAYKELTEYFVQENIDGLVNMHKNVEELIENLFKSYKPIQDLKSSIYGSKDQDTHTSTLPDGSASITIGHNVVIGFDGTEAAGVEILQNFLASLPGESINAQILAKALNIFLKPNSKTKQLNPSRLVQLNELRSEFNSEEFDRGYQIIVDAQHKVTTTMFVSGWKFITLENSRRKKLKFRFSV